MSLLDHLLVGPKLDGAGSRIHADGLKYSRARLPSMMWEGGSRCYIRSFLEPGRYIGLREGRPR